MSELKRLQSNVSNVMRRFEDAKLDGISLQAHYIWTAEIAKRLLEYVDALEAENRLLNAELAKWRKDDIHI